MDYLTYDNAQRGIAAQEKVREAREEANRALRTLASAYRDLAATLPPDGRSRKRVEARARGVQNAIDAIHCHQAERITVGHHDPLRGART